MSGPGMTFSLFGKDVSASKAINGVGSSTKRVGGGFAKFGKVAAVGLGAVATGGIAAGFALKGMVENAAKDEAAQRRLARALKNTAGARKKDIAGVEEYITKTSLAMGVTDDELRPAFQKLVQATGSVSKAQKQMNVAMDTASGSGKSLEAVTSAMMKAQTGSLGALSKLGIKTKDAAGETLSYREVVKSMADTFKGQANDAAESFDGKMSRLKITFDEAKEAIGAKLIPMLDKIASWVLDKGIPGLSKFKPILDTVLGLFKSGGPISEMFSKVMEGVRDAIDGVRKTFEEHRPQLELFFERMKIIAKVLGKAMGTYLKHAFKILGKAIEVVIVVISKLVEWTPSILKNFIKPVVLGFVSMAQFIVAAADTAFGWLPGLGEKLGKARAAIDEFKTKTDRQFDVWAENLHNQGEIAGVQLNKGLAKGIAKSQNIPIEQARGTANKIKAQMSGPNGFDVASPSKWAAKLGSQVNQGFANGLGANDPFAQASRLAVAGGGQARAGSGRGGGDTHLHFHGVRPLATKRELDDLVRGARASTANAGVR